MSKSSDASSGGLGFGAVLFLIFMTLKLTGVIHWSWWWVTAPLWGGVVLFVGIIGIIVLIAAIAHWIRN